MGATVVAALGSTGAAMLVAGTPAGAVSTSSDPAPNLVANGSFEDVGSYRQPTGWTIVP